MQPRLLLLLQGPEPGFSVVFLLLKAVRGRACCFPVVVEAREGVAHFFREGFLKKEEEEEGGGERGGESERASEFFFLPFFRIDQGFLCRVFQRSLGHSLLEQTAQRDTNEQDLALGTVGARRNGIEREERERRDARLEGAEIAAGASLCSSLLFSIFARPFIFYPLL